MNTLRAYVKKHKSLFSQEKFQACFEFTNYLVSALRIQLVPAKSVDSKSLYLVNFLENEHVFFVQDKRVLHSFKGRFSPRINIKPTTHEALVSKDLVKLARSFNMKRFTLKRGDGWDRVAAKDLNKYYGRDAKALQLWQCKF